MVKLNSTDLSGYLARYVDPAPILTELQDLRVISKQEQTTLQGTDVDIVFQRLFTLFTEKPVDVDQLLRVFTKTNNPELGQLLLLWNSDSDSTIPRVHRAKPGIKTEVRMYFNDLKAKFLNATFKDPLIVYRKETMDIEHSLSMVREGDVDQRRLFVDKQIAMIANVLDASIMTFRPQETVADMFKLLTQLVPMSSNTALSDVIFFSRIALMKDLRVYDKKFSSHCQELTVHEDGSEMLQRAQACADTITPCLGLANLYFIHLLHELWRFEANPTVSTKESLLHLGRLSVECLAQESIHVQTLWKRLVYIKTAFCLLGIGNNLLIITGFEPTAEDVYQARDCLRLFDECRQHMPMVRKLEMYYYFARARQYALSGEPTTAFYFAKEVSRLLGKNPTFRETETILSYCREIEMAYYREVRFQSQISEDVDGLISVNLTAVDAGDSQTALPVPESLSPRQYDESLKALPCVNQPREVPPCKTAEETIPKCVNVPAEHDEYCLRSVDCTSCTCSTCNKRLSDRESWGTNIQKTAINHFDEGALFGSGLGREETVPKSVYGRENFSLNCSYYSKPIPIKEHSKGASITC